MAKQRANKTVHGLNRTRNAGQSNFLYQFVENDDETNSKQLITVLYEQPFGVIFKHVFIIREQKSVD